MFCAAGDTWMTRRSAATVEVVAPAICGPELVDLPLVIDRALPMGAIRVAELGMDGSLDAGRRAPARRPHGGDLREIGECDELGLNSR